MKNDKERFGLSIILLHYCVISGYQKNMLEDANFYKFLIILFYLFLVPRVCWMEDGGGWRGCKLFQVIVGISKYIYIYIYIYIYFFFFFFLF
jgi:hypothetical protein